MNKHFYLPFCVLFICDFLATFATISSADSNSSSLLTLSKIFGRGGIGGTLVGSVWEGVTVLSAVLAIVLVTGCSRTLSTEGCIGRAVSGSEFVLGVFSETPVRLARDIGRFGIACSTI